SAFDHRVEDLFDLELPFGLQVGAPGAALADDAAVRIGQQRDGFRAAGVDSQDVHPTSLSAYAREMFCELRRDMLNSVDPMIRPGAPRISLFVCGVALLIVAAASPFRAAAPEQTRALWVTRTTLTSPE